MYTHTDYEALLIHNSRAAELRRAAEQARLAESLRRRRARPGRVAAPWWKRQRRVTGTRRARPA
jgi:hypothetical protein